MCTGLYVLDVRWLYEESIFGAMLGYVDEQRRTKALSYRFVKDRALSLGAGLLLNLALAGTAPDLPWPPRFCTGGQGKPCLAHPGAPQFNLSHSGIYVALAIDKEPVGVDIEKVGSGDVNVAQRCFGPSELLRVLPGGQVDDEAFCRLWALKESYLKFCGEGLALDPLRLTISQTKPLRLYRDGLEKACHLALYEDLAGYKLALCTSRGRPAKRVELISQARLLAALRRPGGA